MSHDSSYCNELGRRFADLKLRPTVSGTKKLDFYHEMAISTKMAARYDFDNTHAT